MSGSPHPAVALNRLPLFNPSRLNDEEILASFIVRRDVADRLITDVGAERADSRPQHHLVVGQRGMGKTTLLARLGAEMRSGTLAAKFAPLVFAEEQYSVDRLSKFWLNCLDALADAEERAGRGAEAKAIDDVVDRLAADRTGGRAEDAVFARVAYDAFAASARHVGRRPVLLVDNLQMVFAGIDEGGQHALREILMRPGAPILVGASPSPPLESRDYGAAFYDQFKIHYLRALDLAEMRDLLLMLSDSTGRPDVRSRIESAPARLQVLRLLTGGNPRTVLTLFHLYAEDFGPSAFGDLENLLDRVTPLYKARFEELAEQQRVVASAIADAWDPVTAREVAEATRLPVTQIPQQLERLERVGMVERVERSEVGTTGWQIAERFFNVWYLMRSASRRRRRELEFLTRFLESFYENGDRERLARRMLEETGLTIDRLQFAIALKGTPIPEELRLALARHTDLEALRRREGEARRRVAEIVDLSAIPPATLAFNELRERLEALVGPDSTVDPAEFSREILGCRSMLESGERERIAGLPAPQPGDVVERLRTVVHESRAADEVGYSKGASDWLSSRLVSGQIRSFRDSDDWVRTFAATSDSETMRIAVESAPLAAVRTRSVEERERIARVVWPNSPLCALHMAATPSLTARLDVPAFEAQACRELSTYPAPSDSFREILQSQATCRLADLLWTRLGKPTEAEALLRTALRANPGSVDELTTLTRLVAQAPGRTDEAKRLYEEALRADDRAAGLWNNYGVFLLDRTRDVDRAFEAFQRASDLDPTNPVARLNLVTFRRDYRGEHVSEAELAAVVAAARNHIPPDTLELLLAVSAALDGDLDEFSGRARAALAGLPTTIPGNTMGEWVHDAAMLVHLGFGDPFLSALESAGADLEVRPYYEALHALQHDNPRLLLDVAPEVRVPAQELYEAMRRGLDRLPASTRRISARKRSSAEPELKS